ARFQCHAAGTTDTALVEQVAGGDADIGAGDDALVADGLAGIERGVTKPLTWLVPGSNLLLEGA
ncbi:hypothetical protein, partial [Xanthomonas phaseoli]|uniref:hypothetical protein n=1 Tax=Xanthomonas phaseoli TaxID=1985254 RepID=UPI00052899A5